MRTGRRIIIPLPRPPGFLVGILIALSIVGAFMALDRTVLHWYTQDSGRLERIEHGLSDLRGDIGDVKSDIATLQRTKLSQTGTRWIYVPQEDAENAENYPGQGPPPCADFRRYLARTAYPGSEPVTIGGATWVAVECK